MIRFATTLLILVFVSVGAAAKEAKVGNTSLQLPLPHGYCEMDPVLASDAHLFAGIHANLGKTGNRLLMLAADCAELKEWRDGKRAALEQRINPTL